MFHLTLSMKSGGVVGFTVGRAILKKIYSIIIIRQTAIKTQVNHLSNSEVYRFWRISKQILRIQNQQVQLQWTPSI